MIRKLIQAWITRQMRKRNDPPPAPGTKRILIKPSHEGFAWIIQEEYYCAWKIGMWIPLQSHIGIIEDSTDIEWYRKRMGR